MTLSEAAIIIASISAIGVTGSLLLNWRIVVKENNRKYVELVNLLQNQLNQLIDRKLEPKTPEELMRLIYQYLNKVEEIAFFTLKKKIPNDIAEYFAWWLKDGYSIIMELDKKTVSENDILHKGTWTYLIQWKKKFYPKINKFYPNDEQSIFLLELNRLSKNSEG